MRWTRTPRSLSPLAALAVVALLLLTPGGHGASSREEAVDAARWAGLVGGERRPVAHGQRMIVVLNEPSLADQVALAGGRAGEAQMRAWTSAAVASQKQLAARLARAGFLLTPEFTFSRVLNGFSAPLDPRGVALLERDPDVAGVYAVRTAYPASVSSSELGRAGRTLGPAFKIAGRDGTGVTVALLDTGVDRSHPYLRDRVLEGIDVLAPDSTAVARQHPLIPGRPERHGTELAGIVAGHGGPNGISGVAPGVTILPIRIAGWQPDAAGGFAIYGRTDQLIAGLDRAVDPNGDGDAHDAARVALVGVAEPFAGFATGAVAQAVEGATKLDTLVVAPAGNDGPSGPSYGSVAGPGGAPDALTVAAGDERASIETVRVLVRAGLDVLVDAPLPLGGAVEARHPVTLALAVPGPADPRLPPDRRAFARFFDRKGFSVVAGRAALVPEGNALLEAQRDAAQAGAAAVVIDGVAPAGSLGLDERVGVPVVGIPHVAADAVRKALAEGADVTISLGDPGTARNPRAGGIASFSSRGLALAGGVKPEVAAPGIALATSEPGRNDDKTANYGTVNGTSASAAVVAGAAALLAQARPALDAAGMRSVLVGTARPPEGTTVSEAGGALLDLGRAVAAEVGAEPATVAFGPVYESGSEAVREVVLRNLSTRRLEIELDALVPGVRGVSVSVSPRAVVVPRGKTATVKLTARVDFLSPRLGAVEGTLRVSPVGGVSISVPWAVAFPPGPDGLLSDVKLSRPSFRPADTAPSVLTLRAGEVTMQGGLPQVQPVELLEVQLWQGERKLGVLARLRDVLPGSYAFGLTGRGPRGGRLAIGDYTLRIVATPAGGGEPAVRTLRVRIR